MGLRLAIVGATGLVGRKLLEIIELEARKRAELGELNAPGPEVETIGCFASADSAGKVLHCNGQELRVQDLAACDFADYDAALFAVGDELSAKYVPQALAAGCAVVDKSNAFRLRADVPLVVAGVNDYAVTAETRLVANPNCSTIILAHALYPLQREFGLSKVFAATYQSVSGAGSGAVDELARQIAAAPAAPRIAAEIEAAQELGGDGYAYNVIPAIGGMQDGRCSEERKLIEESRKVFGQPDLTIVAHAARVPVVIGHSIAVTAELQRLAPRELITSAWQHSDNLIYLEDELPTPVSSQQGNWVEVGRLRPEPGLDNGWSFFISGDNVNIGAALNGWRILKLLVAAGAVHEQAMAG